MRARARIVAEAGPNGVTVLRELRGEAPLLPRATGARSGPVAEIHLVGGAAGPLGGDELRLHIEVGPGASLVLRTVAATVALPGPTRAPSSSTVEATVAAGARFAWLPEPTVAAAGCDHTIVSRVECAAGAWLVWREELVAGRWGEQPGRLRQLTRLRHDGVDLLVQDLALGPGSGWTGPAIGGGNRTGGSLVIVDPSTPQWTEAALGDAARMPLAGPAVLTSAVAADIPALRKAIADLSPPGWV
jgi:urease accessory protein